ncbi:AraC family transcriptional regulator (plasmid) [Pseudonocardia bannensis]|uniref:AraC family transcriptional regulator n=1 Tax=Pseudonocardia bannensis TaxID=630973 RepID=A0A848DPB5_9PSEU|nr:AraC family transcriptional regulator [Pseudonocardia bannensis]NMH94349.1 AraC family transcriptional regulator [Pseudonocardia bannensis]
MRSAFSTMSFTTTDVDEARHVLTRSYADHSIRLIGRTARNLRFGHRVALSPLVNIGYTTFGTDLDIAAPPTSTAYIVCFTTRGHATMTCGGESALLTPAHAAIAAPDKQFGFECWSDASNVVGIRIRRDALEDDLATLIGRPVAGPVRFKFEMNVSTGPGAAFLRTLHLIEAELERPDGMSHDSWLTERLSRLLIASLLTAQPHDHSEQLREPGRAAASTAVRAAMEFVESNPSEITTVVEIAQAACVSVRALEHGFRKHVGVSPMAYLRDVRLARVHEELLSSDPRELSITRTARRWGFAHLSRFSNAYRQKYGVLPSETLRGRRADDVAFDRGPQPTHR